MIGPNRLSRIKKKKNVVNKKHEFNLKDALYLYTLMLFILSAGSKYSRSSQSRSAFGLSFTILEMALYFQVSRLPNNRMSFDTIVFIFTANATYFMSFYVGHISKTLQPLSYIFPLLAYYKSKETAIPSLHGITLDPCLVLSTQLISKFYCIEHPVATTTKQEARINVS